jgi:hypothetical protein
MILNVNEEMIFEEIADKQFKRDDIALTYCLLMFTSEKIDWSKVNHAILDRWSRSGLTYIKKKAHRFFYDKYYLNNEIDRLIGKIQ